MLGYWWEVCNLSARPQSRPLRVQFVQHVPANESPPISILTNVRPRRMREVHSAAADGSFPVSNSRYVRLVPYASADVSLYFVFIVIVTHSLWSVSKQASDTRVTSIKPCRNSADWERLLERARTQHVHATVRVSVWFLEFARAARR